MGDGIENIKKYVDKELMWGYIIVVILIVLGMLDIYKSRLVFYFVIPFTTLNTHSSKLLTKITSTL